MSAEKCKLRNNQKEILEIKKMATEIKNVFAGLMNRQGAGEERISDLECMSVEMF